MKAKGNKSSWRGIKPPRLHLKRKVGIGMLRDPHTDTETDKGS